ncbi:hypothetical protein L1S32_02170 [Methanogenium sp. S4BF]|uniref:hypothetical protein n=1 Tax=Methanogenium sp. S4BF TaxID=1789226 RepID=UPI002416BAA8|nr:hypothetical protein [Methanogenium sp. S4BF]WFN34947.1 hypothetical protein L1S32_02170 [Methanogenium sp. S4BF]
MQTEPGTLSLVRGGTLALHLAEETYSLTRDDIHTLLFNGQSVPLTRTEEVNNPDGAVFVSTVIDGHITVHASGRAVIAATRGGLYSIPFACFRQVTRGEAASAPLFPVHPALAGGFL